MTFSLHQGVVDVKSDYTHTIIQHTPFTASLDTWWPMPLSATSLSAPIEQGYYSGLLLWITKKKKLREKHFKHKIIIVSCQKKLVSSLFW